MNFALKLSSAFGPPNYENEVREIIKEYLGEKNFSYKTDPVGSLIVKREGKIKHGIILSAHMDEVGFIISKINKDGTVSFRKLGGIDDRLLPGKRIIIGKEKIPGIIMHPPIHLQKTKKVVSWEDLRIHIGYSEKKKTEKHVKVGDYGSFYTQADTRGKRLWGKSWDDRIGCYVISQILKEKWDITITGLFTAQEEVGLRGIQSALHYANGDFGFAVEGTTSFDLDIDDSDDSPSTYLEGGPAITPVDRVAIGSPSMKKLLEQVGKKENIPFQYKKTATGGTETFYLLRKHLPAICVSVPVRYIHAPLGMCSTDDVDNTIKLLKSAIKILEKKMKKIYGGS